MRKVSIRRPGFHIRTWLAQLRPKKKYRLVRLMGTRFSIKPHASSQREVADAFLYPIKGVGYYRFSHRRVAGSSHAPPSNRPALVAQKRPLQQAHPLKEE